MIPCPYLFALTHAAHEIAASGEKLTGEADYGYCAAKEEPYYGFKLGLRVSRRGFITHYPLLAARPHDVKHLPTLVEEFQGIAPADKGFLDPFMQERLQSRGVEVVVPNRQNMKAPSPHCKALLKVCARWRKKVETVASHLTERFAVARIRVHDLWHFQHRLIRKVLAHTVAVAINIQLRRPPLDLDGLVSINSTQVAH
ncbi:MAG TPA: transposase [Abditibacteriaceae bacterium]